MSDGGYFQQLTAALRQARIFQPCLVLDLDRMDMNIASVKSRLPAGLTLRIVDKSLPCLPLIDHVRHAFDTRLVMTFHPQVTLAVLERWPDMGVLYGKPMPVELARQVLAEHPQLAPRITWLIDTPERLAQYGAIARAMSVGLNICFEVDIGMHRGGLPNPDALRAVLAALASFPGLKCRGVMGYEAHIGHIPGLLGGPEKARAKSIGQFQHFVAELGPDQRKILNLGGSSTALTYDCHAGANELSMGSAFVKPADFDVPSLAQLSPAIFIAAPVLKAVDVQLPGLDARSWIAQRLGFLPHRGCYVFGGKWMAKPVFPEGMAANSSFGQSTNQQFFSLPANSPLKVDDYVFLRPTQSEFVLQQFGTIRGYSQGKIVNNWPALPFS